MAYFVTALHSRLQAALCPKAMPHPVLVLRVLDDLMEAVGRKGLLPVHKIDAFDEAPAGPVAFEGTVRSSCLRSAVAYSDFVRCRGHS